MFRALMCTVLALAMVACSSSETAIVHKPPHKSWVNDEANLLTQAEELQLSETLQAFAQATGHQMVIATVPSLNGQDIKTFTTDLGNAWGIGSKDEDDGILLVVAPTERQARIGVGYGLEKTLPDALCQQVIDELMVPRFRKGEWSRGLADGIAALARRMGYQVPAVSSGIEPATRMPPVRKAA